MKFEWNNRKAAANIEEHDVSFDEAKTVFSDDYARLIFDSKNSNDEDRYILLGLSSDTRILTVVHVEIVDDLVRIISARKATKTEATQYRRFKA